MNRQPSLDAVAVRCLYARQPELRPHCQLTAVVRYGRAALCADCDARRSTLGKAERPHRLPSGPAIDVVRWIAEADQRLCQAHNELTVAVRRARCQGHSWSVIAAELKITRQAAQQRFRQDYLPGG